MEGKTRTTVRIEAINRLFVETPQFKHLLDIPGSTILVRVPDWNRHKIVEIPMLTFPPGLDLHLVPDAIFSVMADLSVEQGEDLGFEDWEYVRG